MNLESTDNLSQTFIYGSIEEINILNPDNIRVFVPSQKFLSAVNLLKTFND